MGLLGRCGEDCKGVGEERTGGNGECRVVVGEVK